MKRLLNIVLAGLMGLCSTGLMAAEMKIGVLDLHKIIQQSAEVKTINQQLEKTFKPRQQAIVKMQQELEADVAKFKRNSSVLSAADKAQLEDKIHNNKITLSRKEQDYQQELMSEQNKSMQKFFNKLRKAVTAFAERNKYDLILQKEAVPFASSSVEITDQVLKDLT